MLIFDLASSISIAPPWVGHPAGVQFRHSPRNVPPRARLMPVTALPALPLLPLVFVLLAKREREAIDYILTKRRYLSNVKDAEANDMIHMGSDHRCIMATFLISTPEKNKHNRREDKKRRPTVNIEQTKKTKNINIENPELEERCQDIIVTLEKAAAKKENEAHDTRNNAKDQMERKNAAAAAEAESTLVETVAQDTEGRSKKRSSKDDNQRDAAAASEAESTLVDTVAHETHEAQQHSRQSTGWFGSSRAQASGRVDVYTPWK